MRVEKNSTKKKGVIKMTDSAKLKEKIEKSGLKLGYIVKRLNTSYSWLNKKIENKRPFTAEEIQTLCSILKITSLKEKNEIFFAEDVEKNSTK